MVRPESERLHDFLSAQIMESHLYTARAIQDLSRAIDRISESEPGPSAALDAAYAHRALAGLPAGSSVLELGFGQPPLAPALAALGYKVTLVSREAGTRFAEPVTVVASPVEESQLLDGSFNAIVALGLGSEIGMARDLFRFASPGAILVLSHRRAKPGEVESLLGAWSIVNTFSSPDQSDTCLLTARGST